MPIKHGVISGTTLKKRLPGADPHVPIEFATSEPSKLESIYPIGTVIDAFVTNVHDVPQLRFFMFVMNSENAQHFANVRYAATPPNAYKCLRMPREGYVFAVRLGESTLVRAVRLRTMCITKLHEVFLPDIGRNYELKSESEMYHLPAKLREPPGLAVLCQLRGINDDVTILPKNMRTFVRGLLFRSVKLRVDGYFGDMLKVQLMGVTMDKLIQWTDALGEEEHDFCYALKHTVLYKPKKVENGSRDATKTGNSNGSIRRNEKSLSPIAEIPYSSDDECINNDDSPSLANMSTPSTPPTLSSLSSSDSMSYTLSVTAFPALSSVASSISGEDQSDSNVSTLVNTKLQYVAMPKNDSSLDDEDLTIAAMRPILGCLNTHVRPILGCNNVQKTDNSWKRDVLPALFLVDNRHLKVTYPRQELLTITPTCIGQLERFFGVVHRRDECYMQHMWTDEEIPLPSRYTGSRTPYIFDIVLAKHSGDFKWYRAKVIKIDKQDRKVLVFFVDYGGIEYVDLWNLANLGRKISKLPFQAVLFRLHDLTDVTTTKAERCFGVDFLRTLLFKKTLTVRVLNNRNGELSICLEDQRYSHVPATLIRWGLMEPSTTM